MKTCFLIFCSVFFVSACFAQGLQDTIERREKLSDSVTERFYVLKNNPEIKQGPYLVLLNRKKAIARGYFKNGKKTGIWHFYDSFGRLNERYNYDLGKFSFEAPLSSADFSFEFEDTIKTGDRLTRPLRIGGVYYGFLPYLSLFRVPFDTYDINMETFSAYLELLISPMGRLAAYRVRVVSVPYQYDHIFTMDVKLLSDEDREFLPATKNGENVMSRILIKCNLTPYGTLDFD